MKKLALFTALALVSTAAQANEYKPYIGGGYQYTGVDYDNVPGTGVSYDTYAEDNLHGFEIHAGARLHQYFGIEVGYQYAPDQEQSIPGTALQSEVMVHGAALDVLGYLPIAPKFELIGTAGVTYLDAEVNIPTVGNFDDSEFGGRFGGGAQYWVTDNVNVRGLLRYQTADFDSTVDGAVVGNVALNYQF